jgi:uncharacterized membrane protein
MSDIERPGQKKHRIESLRRSTDMPSDRTKELNLKFNVAALLCYVIGLNLLAAPLWLRTESKGNSFLRFHALQGLVLTGAYVALAFAFWLIGLLGLIPFLGFIGAIAHTLWWFLNVIYVGANIFMMVAAMNEYRVKLPFAGDVAEQLLEQDQPPAEEESPLR